ncbi:MAG: hypothetical protein ABIL09_02335, partial [Gemmatimonadota bacterium]
ADPRVWRRRRWSRPGPEQLSAPGRECLAALRAAPGEVERAWGWIDGRRTVWQILERLQHGGAVELSALSQYLQLLADEGLVEARRDEGQTGDWR